MEGAVLVRCEGRLGGFLQSELLRDKGFLPSFLSGEERDLLGIKSFLSGEGLIEGLLGGFLQSELLRAEGFLPSFLPGEERARGDVLLGGEGDDDLSQAEGDAHLWYVYATV